ncbi:MAG: zinc ribbon domain-containing protein [Clostridiales Family XIII bacterium]|jgi:hypothetical protein|nr:zinc ribbon domain-containing protein [Clostridiales Family XIII bacterium]
MLKGKREMRSFFRVVAKIIGVLLCVFLGFVLFFDISEYIATNKENDELLIGSIVIGIVLLILLIFTFKKMLIKIIAALMCIFMGAACVSSISAYIAASDGGDLSGCIIFGILFLLLLGFVFKKPRPATRYKEIESMYCPNCGNEASDEDPLCKYCGSSLVAGPQKSHSDIAGSIAAFQNKHPVVTQLAANMAAFQAGRLLADKMGTPILDRMFPDKKKGKSFSQVGVDPDGKPIYQEK